MAQFRVKPSRSLKPMHFFIASIGFSNGIESNLRGYVYEIFMPSEFASQTAQLNAADVS
jgi:hypothetical protein